LKKRRDFLKFLTLPAIASALSNSNLSASNLIVGDCIDSKSTEEFLDLLNDRSKADLSNTFVTDLDWGNSGKISYDSITSTWTFTNNSSTDVVLESTFLEGNSYETYFADLAEKYLSDSIYEPGTVLSIGGSNEVTLFNRTLPLAGVVSTNPAMKLNDNPHTSSSNFLFIALKGRIPVKINSPVEKNDFIWADIDGFASSSKSFDFDKKLFLGIALSNSNGPFVEIKV
jgi:hypothetical protein